MIRAGEKTHIAEIISMWSDLDSHVTKLTNNHVLKSRNSNYIEEVNKFLLEIMEKDNSSIFIEDNNGELKGFVSAHVEKLPWFKPATGLIGAIWVNEKHRNKGIGKQLLNHAENWLKTNNVINIQVCWDLENNVAGEFWKSNGYSVRQLRGTKTQV